MTSKARARTRARARARAGATVDGENVRVHVDEVAQQCKDDLDSESAGGVHGAVVARAKERSSWRRLIIHVELRKWRLHEYLMRARARMSFRAMGLVSEGWQ